MKKTNFDRYLEEQMRDPAFAARFERAGRAWDVALQLAALRRQAGLSQKQLARRLQTSQQHISRLESPGYEGHSLANLRRVASALKVRVRVVFEPENVDRESLALSTNPKFWRIIETARKEIRTGKTTTLEALERKFVAPAPNKRVQPPRQNRARG
jgi:transcriptional regulator with XRE-family HTH domain